MMLRSRRRKTNTLGMSSWFLYWKMYQLSPAVTTARAEHQLRCDERAPQTILRPIRAAIKLRFDVHPGLAHRA